MKGYFLWTLVDNFEWAEGWTRRFGLYALNTENQARTKRPSAEMYSGIIRENALTSMDLRRYAPDLVAELLPE